MTFQSNTSRKVVYFIFIDAAVVCIAVAAANVSTKGPIKRTTCMKKDENDIPWLFFLGASN